MFMNSLSVMGLSQEDFTWYNVGLVSGFISRNIPQIINEYTVADDDITIMVLNTPEVSGLDSFKMAFWFRDTYLPVYENGDIYVKANGAFATKKYSGGQALLGIRNES
ncbi:hypothetical protein GCM10007931_08830 [Vibrio algivorus]|uniref:Uncharacterized protein n=2 Tax=Vibrio algivorus TaxID=1667024 RepID=A0ABQ6EM65_9VIBR|nr:hypothetical protein GCM10007931_08830 [Vibrio algivorus]